MPLTFPVWRSFAVLSQVNRRLLLNFRQLTSTNAMANTVVQFPSANKQGDGEGMVFGDVSKTKKGLIVVHEWWGKNKQIEEQGQDLANLGNFVVLVIDMYRGKVAEDNETAGHYMGGLDWEGALQDVEGAANYLKSLGCAKVGVTGFCMGGALAFAAAAVLPDVISAAAPFYGICDYAKYDVGNTKIPVQAHFAERDETKGFCSKAEFEPFIEKLKGNSFFEYHIYDAGHAFVNPLNKIGPNYDEKLKDLAFGRMCDFLNKHLA